MRPDADDETDRLAAVRFCGRRHQRQPPRKADPDHARRAPPNAIRERRCLLPADGWYEWQKVGTEKQPFYMTPPDGHVLAFAGLYEFWRGHRDEADGETTRVVSCS